MLLRVSSVNRLFNINLIIIHINDYVLLCPRFVEKKCLERRKHAATLPTRSERKTALIVFQ